MTDTQADAPDAIFSPEDSLESLWVKAYQGEILGELLFGGIAEQQSDPDRAAKMRVLATLERRTKEAMVPALERAGISTDDDPETLSLAGVLIAATATIPWADTLASFGPITAQYSAMYRRIGDLDPSERATADLLVAHEAALAAFAAAEVSGQTEGTLAQIAALPHMR
jgi:hypothetical protein